MDNGSGSGSASTVPSSQVENDPVRWQWYLFLIPVVLVFFLLVYILWRFTLSRKKAKRRQSILRNVHLVQADIEKERHRLERGGSIASRVSRIASTKSRRNSRATVRRTTSTSMEKANSTVGSKAPSKTHFIDEKSDKPNSIPQDYLPETYNEKSGTNGADLEAALDSSLVAEEDADPDAISMEPSNAPPVTSTTRPNQLRRNETNALSVIGESAASESNGSPESQPEVFVSKVQVEQAERDSEQEQEIVAAPPAHASPFDDDNAALSSANSHSPTNSLSHSASLTHHNMRALSQREASAATTASSGVTHSTQPHHTPSTSVGTLPAAHKVQRRPSEAEVTSPNTSTEGAASVTANPFASPITTSNATSPIARGASGLDANEVASSPQISADAPSAAVAGKRANVVRVREPVPRGHAPSDAEAVAAAGGDSSQRNRRGSADAGEGRGGGGGLGLKRSLSLLTSNALRRSSTSNSSVSSLAAGKGRERGRSSVDRDRNAGGKGLFGLGLVRTRSPIASPAPPAALDPSAGGWTYVPRAGQWAAKSGDGSESSLSSRLPGATVSASHLPAPLKRPGDASGPRLPSGSTGMGGVQQVRSASLGPGEGGTPTWLGGSALARRPSIGVKGSRYKESFDDD